MAIRVGAAIWAGLAAGVISTLVELPLWMEFTGDFPGILFRDARLTAAIIMGKGVLTPPAGFDPWVMAVATLNHFSLSVIYGLAIAVLIDNRRRRWPVLVAGALFGAVLYGVNLYGFTLVFPWFAQARDWITFTAHLAFGISAAGVYHALSSPASQAGTPP